MTSKERMLRAIQRETPDRLPVTIHQWQQYHLKKYMNGITDIEANRICGLDASINYYEEIPEDSSEWRVSSRMEQKEGYDVTHYTITTPEGILTTSEGSNSMTTWVMEHLIKEQEDVELLRKYRPIPKLNKKGVLDTYDALGDGGILRTFVCGKQGGCWQDACELFGLQNLIYATYDDPDWVMEFLTILLDQKLAYIEESLRGMPFDLIETGGGASSNTVISPKLHEAFCVPFDRKMHDALHAAGHLAVYHTCGGMMQITELIARNHCDVSETLSPITVGGDIATDEDAVRVREILHPQVGLIGGMDQFHTLEGGTEDEIRQEVNRLFRLFGCEGGYILSACDHFFEVPPENLKLFAEAARECRY